jgi:hypothetical protein
MGADDAQNIYVMARMIFIFFTRLIEEHIFSVSGIRNIHVVPNQSILFGARKAKSVPKRKK